MATLHSLIGTDLTRITVPLNPGEGQPIREFLACPRVVDWINNVLPALGTEQGAARSPLEEFDDLLFNYISSAGQLRYGKMLKDLMPAKDEAWELKTYQLRVFGWFYRKDQFIAVVPARATEVKYGHKGYKDAIDEVLAVRDKLPLDEPKFVGGIISNVVSGI